MLHPPQTHMDNVFEDVRTEISRQNHLWGEQRHLGHKWNSILVEEVGEFAKALLDMDIVHAREEIVQIAAVAMQIAHAIDTERAT